MILEEKEIKFIFNPYVLIPGDILLMNTYEERFRKKMGCKYEHAAIYIGDAHIMEANGAHVVMSHIYSYAFKEIEHACVLRLNNCSSITLSDIARNARKQMGREYVNTRQFLHVRDLKNTNHKDISNRSFCSRLVAQSYKEENINLVTNADFCEPDDFLNTQSLGHVQNAVVPITEELLNVVMAQQKYREEHELDSPNAELFKNLSELYGMDIQDLGQAIMSSLNKTELDEKAIELIVSSDMFKHMNLVHKEMPWLSNDEEFFKHFKEVDKGMHFLYSQMNHYDHTILPDYKELHVQMIVCSSFYPKCKLLSFLKDHIGTMVDEAISCRKRLTDLFVEMFTRHEKDFIDFIERYGLYAEYEYVEKPLNIDFVLRDILFHNVPQPQKESGSNDNYSQEHIENRQNPISQGNVNNSNNE